MASSVATPLERQFGRIAGLNEMTSSSSLGSCSITMQFDLSRNIDASARDVQAAINAARGQLPRNLPQNPSWRKINPADSPILMIGLTSETMPPGNVYDVAASILQQKLAQMKGVGQVSVGGGALPGVRVDVNPTQLNKFGLGLEDIRTMLASANANRPKGDFHDINRVWSISTTDQLRLAAQYEPLVVTYKNGAAVKLSDVATVTDSVEDIRNIGYVDTKQAMMLVIFRQPGANIIETVDRVLAALPQLQAEVPAALHMKVILDRTTTHSRLGERRGDCRMGISIVTGHHGGVPVPAQRANHCDSQRGRADFAVGNLRRAVSVRLFDRQPVADGADHRHRFRGGRRHRGDREHHALSRRGHGSRSQAALKGAAEIGFTVLSISVSLIAVFLPILMMGGIVGRLFREFAVTLSVAIIVSLVVSLTTTPMMCARLLAPHDEEEKHGWLYNLERARFQRDPQRVRPIAELGVASPVR